ncbi:MAG: hypothetical protein AB1847_21970 [bacterium]
MLSHQTEPVPYKFPCIKFIVWCPGREIRDQIVPLPVFMEDTGPTVWGRYLNGSRTQKESEWLDNEYGIYLVP